MLGCLGVSSDPLEGLKKGLVPESNVVAMFAGVCLFYSRMFVSQVSFGGNLVLSPLVEGQGCFGPGVAEVLWIRREYTLSFWQCRYL